MNSTNFLNAEIAKIEDVKNYMNELKEYSVIDLCYKPVQSQWNALECINHLLLSNEFYLVQIIEEIEKHPKSEEFAIKEFKPGWLGKYLTKNIYPKENGDLKSTMKTFKTMEPKTPPSLGKAKAGEIIGDFVDQLNLFIAQMELAKNSNLKKIRIKSVLGSLIKLDLGSAFSFTIGHIVRHIVQIKKTLPSKTS